MPAHTPLASRYDFNRNADARGEIEEIAPDLEPSKGDQVSSFEFRELEALEPNEDWRRPADVGFAFTIAI